MIRVSRDPILEHVSDNALRRPVDLGDEVAPPLQGPSGGTVRPLHTPKVLCGLLGRGSGLVQ